MTHLLHRILEEDISWRYHQLGGDALLDAWVPEEDITICPPEAGVALEFNVFKFTEIKQFLIKPYHGVKLVLDDDGTVQVVFFAVRY